MKRSIYAALIGALLCGALSVTGLRADEKEGPGEGRGRRERIEAMMKDTLGLTDEQAGKMKAAFQAHKDAVKPLRRRLRDAAITLHDQVEDKAGDDALKATLTRLDEARKGLRAENDKFKDSLSSILSPSQRAKMVLAMGRRRMAMGHGRGMGMGRGGGWGGRGAGMGRRGGERMEDHEGGAPGQNGKQEMEEDEPGE